MPMLRNKNQCGQIVLIMALVTIPLLGAVGLAIDSGMGYIAKAKLNAAIDSAGIAAARAVTQGADQSSQAAAAKTAAREFFNANYKSGYLGSSPTFNDPVVTFDKGKVTIDLAASAIVPVSFTRVMGFTQLDVHATSQTVRKDLDLAFVMDTSGSLSGSANAVRASGVAFLNQFSITTDRVALMHFSYGAVVDDAINPVARGFNRASMTTHINAFSFTGSTNSSEGLWNARNQLNSITPINRSTLRVIVFFSDGSPNSFASYFPFKTASDCGTAGTITTGDGTTASNTSGLYQINKVNTQLSGKCATNGNPTIASKIANLPDLYNAHNLASNPNDPTKQEFKIVTSSPRVVVNDVSSQAAAWRNVNRASRNLAESMASKSRDEGIFVFTLGLGSELLSKNGPDGEKGQDLLKCMANVPDALPRCYNPAKPVGVYCYAATENDLKPCFSRLASEILRLTR